MIHSRAPAPLLVASTSSGGYGRPWSHADPARWESKGGWEGPERVACICAVGHMSYSGVDAEDIFTLLLRGLSQLSPLSFLLHLTLMSSVYLSSIAWQPSQSAYHHPHSHLPNTYLPNPLPARPNKRSLTEASAFR